MSTGHSTPGIYFNEVDNSLVTPTPGANTGAIVGKANQGPVNQRILSNSITKFYKYFGIPTEATDYAHFAASRYLQYSEQLYMIRATFGDEAYGQLQYPFTNSCDKRYAESEEELKYVDNNKDCAISIIKDATSYLSAYPTTSYEVIEPSYVLGRGASVGWLNDLIDDTINGDPVVFAGNADDNSGTDGTYLEFYTTPANTKMNSVIVYDGTSFTSGNIAAMYDNSGNKLTKKEIEDLASSAYASTIGYGTIELAFAAEDTLNYESQSFNASFIASGTYSSAVVAAYLNNSSYTIEDAEKQYGFDNEDSSPISAEAAKYTLLDWSDNTNKTYYLKKEDFTSDTVETVSTVMWNEYNNSTTQYDLATSALNIKAFTELTQKEQEYWADEYGVNVSDLISDDFKLSAVIYQPAYRDTANTDDSVEMLVSAWNNVGYKYDGGNYLPKATDTQFIVYQNTDNSTVSTTPIYTYNEPGKVIIPWGANDSDINSTKVESASAIMPIYSVPTSEILKTDRYSDGYTLKIETDDEPGNGDVETYTSDKESQLVITSIGPGEYGNDIGIAIITPSAENVESLNIANAFNWKYKYDDDGTVELDTATWRKVYRINVYIKDKNKTATKAWGTGLSSLTNNTPVESWYVSNDPTAKDANGNLLYAPNVINGNSDYIYISRAAIGASKNKKTYALPEQTYSIYAFHGGVNGTKTTMKEKTAALELYRDPNKTSIDILFNVDAADSMSSKEKFKQHQDKIADIASSREKDIAVVQVTSKEAKVARSAISEAKNFNFDKPSYVAQYAGYDKFYDEYTSNYIYLPKSVAAAMSMAYCDKYAYPWLGPAGVKRGTIDYSTNELLKLNEEDIGNLYNLNVNCSKTLPIYGEVLWGIKTAQKKETARNRITVRRALNYIEKNYYYILLPYLFDNNTESTRSSVYNSINEFMKKVKSAEGVDWYKLVCDSSNNTDAVIQSHTLKVDLSVRFPYSIEFIDVTINIEKGSKITVSES